MREGGFCIGMTDDAFTYSDGELKYSNFVSRISVIGTAATTYELQRIHPGMHNLRPMAHYPAWKTCGELCKGSYIFASTVFFSDGDIPDEEPILSIGNGSVYISFLGHTESVNIEENTI